MSGSVDDRPVPIEELDDLVALVRDADRVEEEPSAGCGRAVLGRVASTHVDADARRFGLGVGLEEIGFAHDGRL